VTTGAAPTRPSGQAKGLGRRTLPGKLAPGELSIKNKARVSSLWADGVSSKLTASNKGGISALCLEGHIPWINMVQPRYHDRSLRDEALFGFSRRQKPLPTKIFEQNRKNSQHM
jgi:hypothetical protein